MLSASNLIAPEGSPPQLTDCIASGRKAMMYSRFSGLTGRHNMPLAILAKAADSSYTDARLSWWYYLVMLLLKSHNANSLISFLGGIIPIVSIRFSEIITAPFTPSMSRTVTGCWVSPSSRSLLLYTCSTSFAYTSCKDARALNRSLLSSDVILPETIPDKNSSTAHVSKDRYHAVR